jgi:hypothetical protein
MVLPAAYQYGTPVSRQQENPGVHVPEHGDEICESAIVPGGSYAEDVVEASDQRAG